MTLFALSLLKLTLFLGGNQHPFRERLRLRVRGKGHWDPDVRRGAKGERRTRRGTTSVVVVRKTVQAACDAAFSNNSWMSV